MIDETRVVEAVTTEKPLFRDEERIEAADPSLRQHLTDEGEPTTLDVDYLCNKILRLARTVGELQKDVKYLMHRDEAERRY